ncbi:RAMP superfamily CRISPR-associated protein [Paraglaciecola sp. 20A4]|uniref:RAMP superfamily CRISPR-associated protein n=1 Tax=Paraglaciecola sp. 20A4 TaxID=2687288 RepID=UPI001409F33F|nr:RAMP superfamily CRISPR-associated protein [Paraglaciecola sp. 20A4]
MSEVYNPYYFVPFAAQNQANHIAANKQALKDNQISHDAYYNMCGDITLTLTTVTDAIVGNQQINIANAGPLLPEALVHDNKDARFQLPYLRDGMPAIAGNSLRGMISSITEVISASPPRVLDDEEYVVREKSPSLNYAMGVLLKGTRANGTGKEEREGEEAPEGAEKSKEEDDNDIWLHPLGMPFVNWDQKTPDNKLEPENYVLPQAWQDIFTSENGTPLQLSEIMAIRLPGPTSRNSITCSRINTVSSHTPITCEQGECKPIDSHTRHALSDFKVNSAIPKNHAVLHTCEKKTGKTDLIKRILCKGNSNDSAQKTKYLVRRTDKSQYAFLGDDKGRFNAKRIRLDNAKVLQPYLQKFKNAQEGKYNKKGQLAKLPIGEIVLFCLDDDNQIVLKKSAMWREKLQYSTHQLLAPNELPYSPTRLTLSPAEQLFGAICDSKTDKSHLSAFASRLRFYDAIATAPHPRYGLEYKKMPLQGSPMPPCPAMYFSYSNDSGSNEQFNQNAPRPNGAKRYLRQPEPQLHLTNIDAGIPHGSMVKDNSQDKNQLRVSPLPSGTELKAKISFNNLSKDELGLLLNALTPRNAPYVHQVGLGKNLGLGQINLSISGVSLINRPQRYSATGLQSPRASTLNEQEFAQLINCDKLINDTSMTQLYALNQDYSTEGGKIEYPTRDQQIYKWFAKNNQQRLSTDQDGNPKPLKLF